MTTPHEAVTAALAALIVHDECIESQNAHYGHNDPSDEATAAIEALRKGATERVDRMEGEMQAQGRTIFITDYVHAILGPPNEVPE